MSGRLLALAAAAVLALAPIPAVAQMTAPPPVADANGRPLSPPDPNNSAFYGEVALTVGTPDTIARRSLKAVCTVGGNVAVTYYDGSTGVWVVQVGTQTLPLAITQVNASGTTATCTYTNLK